MLFRFDLMHQSCIVDHCLTFLTVIHLNADVTYRLIIGAVTGLLDVTTVHESHLNVT